MVNEIVKIQNQLTELTESQREEALKKYHIIEPYLKKECKLKFICEKHGLSTSTAGSWVSQFKKFGLKGLARKQRADQGLPRACEAEIKECIQGLYLHSPHLSVASIYRKIEEYGQNHNKKVPCYRTVRQYINQIPKAMTTLAHEGKKAYQQQFDLLNIRESKAPNEIWQADHALLDILIKHEKNEKGERPWLTIVFDDYSRAVAGFELSFNAPSAIKTSLALRQSIWRKQDPNWSICGIPSVFYTDHGSDFTSSHIEEVCLELKMQLIFSNIGEPRGRGKIERFFLTINQMLLSELPGYTKAKQPKPTLSLVELNQKVRDFIRSYNDRVHSTTKETPKLRWEANGFLPRMPDSIESLDLLLMTFSKPRQIRRDGIHFQGLRYIDPVLADYIGCSIVIRYDPADLTSIRVFYKNSYLCQPICHDLNNQAVGLKEIQSARIARRKALEKEVTNKMSLVDSILLQSTTKATDDVKVESHKPKPKRKLKLYAEDD